jgi:acid phosphatase
MPFEPNDTHFIFSAIFKILLNLKNWTVDRNYVPADHLQTALPAGFRFVWLFFIPLFLLAGCGGVTGQSGSSSTNQPSQPSQNFQFGHIFILVEENASYSNVISNPSMPYLNGLGTQYGIATNYYANAHPSIPNYFELTTGQTLTFDDSATPTGFRVSADNVVRELIASGKSWKAYAESLPSVGYTGSDTGEYAVRHNPLAFFSDVQDLSTQMQNLVPFSQLASDLSAGNLPQYSFIIPNLCDDAHNCSLSTADSWLQNNIDPLIKDSQFQKNGLLIIVFDEADTSDVTNGGGHIAAVLVSPFSKRGFQSSTFYQHQSVLRISLEGLGVTKLPSDAAKAPAMWEFFNAQ